MGRHKSKKPNVQSATESWGEMVPSKITERVKLDIHMLRLRNAIDPTQHYKKFDAKDLSKTFQVGTIIDDATDFYSLRSTKRDRKKDIIDSILSDPASRTYYNRRFKDLQMHKQKSAKDLYRKRMQAALPSWKFKSNFKK